MSTEPILKIEKKTLKETCENEAAVSSRAALLKLSVDALECTGLQMTKGIIPAHSSLMPAAA